MDSSNKDVPFMRRIRSFVLREGRLTTGQEKALNELFPVWGIEFEDKVLDLKEVFGNDNPVTVEIGFGMGQSLAQMAKDDPNRNFLGIEVHTPGVGALLSLIKENNLTNIRIIRHDAVEILEKMLQNESIDRLQLFFPDPWHKARHHKRRIVNDEFIKLVITKLKIRGIIHMATDWEDYSEQMLQVLSNFKELKNLSKDGFLEVRPQERPLTKFEARGLRLGHVIRDIKFQKQ
ncbi:MAG: tRNA (guanosine(46)-N7)-methyltransferase TrmB [Succinivibrionaceae bacterium]|nr:tRNA (guanosine(46)-N7)-methyltransferase TrmB [Succinivibrionaceae bacterium]MEE1340626.1 tRNA (guanosine(46)-N7)-methyltransferase TrmB [Succinivibrionaceae bacterium]